MTGKALKGWTRISPPSNSSTLGTSYSTSWPPSESPRKILSLAVFPFSDAFSSACTSACALEAMSFLLAELESKPYSFLELALRAALLPARHVRDLAVEQLGQVLR